MVILIDAREPEPVKKAVIETGVPWRVEDIEWCDYIAKVDKYEVPVERKTANDFVASIEDGRIFLQAYMMSTVAPVSYIIVEGSIVEALFERRFPRHAYIGALSSLALKTSPYGERGHISIINLDNYYDTALFLKYLHKQLREGKLHRVPRIRNLERAGLDKKGFMIMVLQAIPGIGAEKAKLIADKFNNLREIMDAPEYRLSSIPGIGSKLAKRIKEYLS